MLIILNYINKILTGTIKLHLVFYLNSSLSCYTWRTDKVIEWNEKLIVRKCLAFMKILKQILDRSSS